MKFLPLLSAMAALQLCPIQGTATPSDNLLEDRESANDDRGEERMNRSNDMEDGIAEKRAAAPYTHRKLQSVTWGLDRIDQRTRSLDQLYNPTSGVDGTGVDIYILDTGLDPTHPSFRGRTVAGVDCTTKWPPVCVPVQSVNNDPNGRGTHLAGIAVADSYGVARGARAVQVRIMRAGQTDVTEPISAEYARTGINWVVAQHKAGIRSKSVIVLSLLVSDGPLQWKKDYIASIQAAVDAGVVVVVAAGDQDQDANNSIPAKLSSVITVAASNQVDYRWARGSGKTSNWGSSVDIFAPGDSILSTWPNTQQKGESGTAQAAAFVAGGVAMLLQNNPSTNPTIIKSMLINNASTNKLNNVRGSPNKLLYVKYPYIQIPKDAGWTGFLNQPKGGFSANRGTDPICGISSTFSSSDRNRQFRFKYCNPADTTYNTQTIPYTQPGNKQAWAFNCPAGQFVSTLTSGYYNQDRYFGFGCSSFTNYKLSQCFTTDWYRGYLTAFDFDSGSGFIIAGMESQYDGSYVDRRFKFKICGVIDGRVTQQQAPSDTQEIDTSSTSSSRVGEESWITGLIVIGGVLAVSVASMVYLGRKNQWSWWKTRCPCGRQEEENDNDVEEGAVKEEMDANDSNHDTSLSMDKPQQSEQQTEIHEA